MYEAVIDKEFRLLMRLGRICRLGLAVCFLGAWAGLQAAPAPAEKEQIPAAETQEEPPDRLEERVRVVGDTEAAREISGSAHVVGAANRRCLRAPSHRSIRVARLRVRRGWRCP